MHFFIFGPGEFHVFLVIYCFAALMIWLHHAVCFVVSSLNCGSPKFVINALMLLLGHQKEHLVGENATFEISKGFLGHLWRIVS